MRIEVRQDARWDYIFYIWKGLSILEARYGYSSAIEAAEAGAKALSDLKRAKKIARRARWFR